MRLILAILLLSVTCFASPKINLENPTLALNGVVDAETAIPLLMAIEHFDNDPSIRGITLKINSPGGRVDVGWVLIDRIEKSRLPFTCVVDRDAASMAFMILQACDVRLMTKRSTLMAHQISLGFTKNTTLTLKELEELASLTRIEDSAQVEHEVAKMKITAAEFRKRTEGKDWFMNWEEALKVGAVDGVVSPYEIGIPLVINFVQPN